MSNTHKNGKQCRKNTFQSRGLYNGCAIYSQISRGREKCLLVEFLVKKREMLTQVRYMQGEILEIKVMGDTYQRKTEGLPLYALQPFYPGFIKDRQDRLRREEEQRQDDQRPRVQVDISYWEPPRKQYDHKDETPTTDRGVTIIEFYNN